MRCLSPLQVIAGIAWALTVSAAHGQFPDRPIEFVIPFAAGGGADVEGRTLADEMSDVLGVPVVPVNKAGAGGAVAYSYVNNAAPDGYTVVWNSNSILTVTNLGNVSFGYDALDHVGRVEYQPMVFAVSSHSEWTDFGAFLEDCKANPGRYRVANSGTGSATHLGALALMTAAGCNVIHLPIGIQRRNSTVLSGEADAMMAPLTGAINLARANRFNLLLTLSTERNAVIPDVPYAAELGIETEFDVFRGLSVPNGTPPEVVSILAGAMMQAAQSEAFLGLAKEVGFTVAPLGVEEFATLLANDNEKVALIVREAGLEP